MDISQVELIILAALGATFTWGTTAFLSLDCTFFVPFIASWILGAVLGDYKTGLIVGATIQTINMAPVMVGGMTASMVTFNSTYELTMKGESVLNLQNMLDQIFIGIVPLGLTLLCYYLLKKKNISITVLIIGVIILSILLSLLGIA